MTRRARPVRFALRFRGRELPLAAGLFDVGSDPGCGVQVEAAGVRPRHLRLRVATEEVHVESVEGPVEVDGAPVQAPSRLPPGAVLRLGDARLRFVDYHAGLDDATTSRIDPGATVQAALERLAALDDAVAAGRWGEVRDRLSALAHAPPAAIRRATLLDALTRAAAALGANTAAPRWIDWALEQYARHRHVPSSSAVDAVAQAAPRCGWSGGASLDALVHAARTSDAAEQVRLRRLAAVARRGRR